MSNVLLVEDNEANRMIIEDMFDFDDIPARLVSVESAERALELIPHLKPALILMDIRLPGLDGLQTVHQLRANPANKDLPIWCITAYAMLPDRDKAYAAGCSAYITKPIDTKALADRLREFFSKDLTREYAT